MEVKEYPKKWDFSLFPFIGGRKSATDDGMSLHADGDFSSSCFLALYSDFFSSVALCRQQALAIKPPTDKSHIMTIMLFFIPEPGEISV